MVKGGPRRAKGEDRGEVVGRKVVKGGATRAKGRYRGEVVAAW